MLESGRYAAMVTLFQLGIMLLLLVCSGFFASAEVACFSLSPLHLDRLGGTRPEAAARLRSLLGAPARLLSTVLIGNTLVNIALSILAYALFERLWPGRGEILSIPSVTALLLVFGEVGPKRLAMDGPERLAALYAAPLLLVQRLLTPLHIVFSRITAPSEQAVHGRGLDEAEYQTAVELGHETGVVRTEERGMVRAILRLGDLCAADVMTPRVDLLGIDLDDPQEDVDRLARSSRVRYLLLYRGQPDRDEGLLDVRAYLLRPGDGLAAAWRPSVYVPETARLDRVLTRFEREGLRMAVVVDEYGGTAGVITRGDILEEITGDIGEEDPPGPQLEQARPGVWFADGALPLDELNERTGLALREESADRLAGWIMARLERMPRPGDACTDQGVCATVRRMHKHRIVWVKLERIGEGEGPPA